MPRTKRLEPPGALHHIMAHSIEHKDMFRDDEDRLEFLSRLAKGLKRTGFQCYTWTLMDNHYHLLIRANHLKLEKLMRGLNGGYAQYYNNKYEKRGHLNQGRFKSSLCQDVNYEVRLIKYINLNPLRAGKVKSLEELKEYTWCGHGYLLGKKGALGEKFQNREWCLSRFGDEEKKAMDEYLRFLEENYVEENPETAGELAPEEHNEIVKSFKGKESVIGETEYVENAFKQYSSKKDRKHSETVYPTICKSVADMVCKNNNIASTELFKRGRLNEKSRARTEFCYHLHRNELIPLSVIAKYLKISVSPVTRMVEIGDNLYREKVSCSSQ